MGVFCVIIIGAAVVEGASGTAEEVGWAAVHGFWGLEGWLGCTESACSVEVCSVEADFLEHSKWRVRYLQGFILGRPQRMGICDNFKCSTSVWQTQEQKIFTGTCPISRSTEGGQIQRSFGLLRLQDKRTNYRFAPWLSLNVSSGIMGASE